MRKKMIVLLAAMLIFGNSTMISQADSDSTDVIKREVLQTDASYLKGNELVIPEIRTLMTQRKTDISVPFDVHEEKEDFDFQILVNTVMEEVFAETDESMEGDYLRYQYDMIDWTYEDHRLSMTVSYYSDEEQEAQVEKEIKELIKELNLEEIPSDYDKVKTVYTYLCEQILYDTEHQADHDYRLKYSAYSAIHDKKTLCNGYATLFYRIMKELDIPARCVTGIGMEEGETIGNHIWNIVNLYGTYYLCDSTWDAREEDWTIEEYEDYLSDYGYDYFLTDQDIFEEEHVPDGIWALQETKEIYQVSEESFESRMTRDSCEHQLVDDEGRKKTLCTEEGLSKGSHCKKCGATLFPQKVLQKEEHQIKVINEKASTCIQEGNTEAIFCENCSYTEKEAQMKPKSRHIPAERRIPASEKKNEVIEIYCSYCNEVLETKNATERLVHLTLFKPEVQ